MRPSFASCVRFAVVRLDDDLWHAIRQTNNEPAVVLEPGYDDPEEAKALARLMASVHEHDLEDRGVTWVRTI
jgi:hypothetical protein